MSPVLVLGGSQLRWAPSVDLEILMALGAPGKPEGKIVTELSLLLLQDCHGWRIYTHGDSSLPPHLVNMF